MFPSFFCEAVVGNDRIHRCVNSSKPPGWLSCALGRAGLHPQDSVMLSCASGEASEQPICRARFRRRHIGGPLSVSARHQFGSVGLNAVVGGHGVPKMPRHGPTCPPFRAHSALRSDYVAERLKVLHRAISAAAKTAAKIVRPDGSVSLEYRAPHSLRTRRGAAWSSRFLEWKTSLRSLF